LYQRTYFKTLTTRDEGYALCILVHGFLIIEVTAEDQPIAISRCAAAQGTSIIEPIAN